MMHTLLANHMPALAVVIAGGFFAVFVLTPLYLEHRISKQVKSRKRDPTPKTGTISDWK